VARRKRHRPLRVLLNNRTVGRLQKASSGAIDFQYDIEWLSRDRAIPISLSLPLREDAYRGAVVSAVFDNLLPDSDAIRRRVAEKVGAEGIDPYSLLTAIGRDCVGALQFVADDQDHHHDEFASAAIRGEALREDEIEKLLQGLAQAPLGLTRDDEFRISVAGAQEKTALLRLDGQWLKPHGTTPTTHILKGAIGELPNGIDLSHSVENEYYCLKLAAAFGLPVANAEIATFGKTKALVIERFDRRWTKEGRLLRIPQEDFCQALSVPPTLKYQSDGGPNLVTILDLLKGSDNPTRDQQIVLKAQILFWLIGATDGHAKNFSIFLGSGGTYRLTPLYDILTAQPSLDTKQIDQRQFRLAMSVGKSRHYRMHEIVGRHFVQTADTAGLPNQLVREAIAAMSDAAGFALEQVERGLPKEFPRAIHDSVRRGVLKRAKELTIV
jgi:serine/threonine-protein kinase HipA